MSFSRSHTPFLRPKREADMHVLAKVSSLASWRVLQRSPSCITGVDDGGLILTMNQVPGAPPLIVNIAAILRL